MEMSIRGMSSLPAAQYSSVDDSVESVLQWISFLQEEWLIVFDNADAPPPEVVEKFIPSGDRGNILITSRNRSMGRIVSFENRIEIKEMEEADAITLLLKASCLDPLPEHLEVSKKIVSELYYIPLAINQAGAYIEAGKCGIAQYLRQFSMHRQTLMSDATFTGASKYSRTVYGTWDLSFKEIERRAGGHSTPEDAQAAQAAILILQICAFYHHTSISEDIFQSAAEEAIKHDDDSDRFRKLPQAVTLLDHTLLGLDNDGYWDEFIFGQGISILLSFSLMKREQSFKIFSVHPLVHYWSRERLSKSTQQKMCEIGSTILSCAVPVKFETQHYRLRRSFLPHIKANNMHERQLGLIKQYYDDKWTKFALVFGENGDWNNAEQLKVQVMDMRKKLLGAEHPDTLDSMGNLALTYLKQGRWNEAEQLQVQDMDVRKKLHGAEHPDTLCSMGNLAITYSDQGRLNEAEQLQVQVMDMRKKLYGAEHPETLTSMGNLALTYWKQGRWNEAEQLQVQVMDMTKKLYGAEHPDTLLSMENLAGTYCNQGRWNEAEQLQVQVMDMTKLYGAEHPDTLNIMGNLALTYGKQGRWNEAEQLQVQVMDMTKKLYGAEHPDTLRSMGNLALTYLKQGRWNEAEQLQVQDMDVRKKLHGAEHPDTLLSMGNLAGTYLEQGKWNEAEQLQVQVMDMSKKLHGAEHPDTLLIMANLAGTYWEQGRWNEAERLQVQVMDMTKKLHGAEHPETLCSMGNLALTYRNQGRWNEAEQLEVEIRMNSVRHKGGKVLTPDSAKK
jgi:Tetratricopeptide repeat